MGVHELEVYGGEELHSMFICLIYFIYIIDALTKISNIFHCRIMETKMLYTGTQTNILPIKNSADSNIGTHDSHLRTFSMQLREVNCIMLVI